MLWNRSETACLQIPSKAEAQESQPVSTILNIKKIEGEYIQSKELLWSPELPLKELWNKF